MLASLIKYIDTYGVSFQFTTFKESKFKSVFGGFITLLCFITIIFFSVILGKDFFYKINPKVVGQTVYPKNYSEPFKLTPENLVIPWRFVDGLNQPIDTQGLFHPKITYYEIINNSSGTTVKKTVNINITRCNSENSKVKEFNQEFNSSEWYCIDWTQGNFSLGGYWDSDFTNYFYITLDFCRDGLFGKDQNCSDFKKVQHFLTNDLYFSCLYPNFYFMPEDIENPLHITYQEYHFILSLNIQKVDRLYFTQLRLLDDSGWMFSNPTEKVINGAKQMNTDLYFFDSDDYGKEGMNSILYTLIFYAQKSYESYSRSFMKIQDLAAVAGGFMNIIFFLGGTVVDFYNTNMRDQKLFSELFQYNEDERNNYNYKNMWNKSHDLDECHKPNLSILKHFHTQPNISEHSLSVDDKTFNLSKVLRYFSQKEINIPKLKNNCFEENKNYIKVENAINMSKNIRPSPQITEIKNSEFQKNLKIKSENKFGLIFMIRRILKCKFKEMKKVKVYDLSKEYLNKRLDVSYYLKTCEGFDQLKSILFNPSQKNALKFLKIPNLADDNELNEFEDKLKEENQKIFDDVINYFKTIKQRGEMDLVDKHLLTLIDPKIKLLSEQLALE